MTVRFDAERHLYFVDDRLVPNVTRMISALNLVDTSFFTEESRERGSHVHQAVHLYIKGELDESSVHPPWRGHVAAAIKLLQDARADLSRLQTEVRVYNARLGYCGTADVLGPIFDFETCLDWKSGAIGEATGIQTALYDLAHPLPGGGRRRRMGAQLRSNGTYKLVNLDRELDPNGLDYHRALALVDFYRRFHWKREERELLSAAA